MNLKQLIGLSGIALSLTVFPVLASACSDNSVIEEPTTPPDSGDGDEETDDALHQTCQTILERIKSGNLSTNASAVDKNAAKWIAQIQENGSFPDIDYSDRSFSWTPGAHLTRVNQMAQAYILKESSYYGNEDLYKQIIQALTYWNTVHPVCDNWYENQISAPQDMGVILILMRYGKTQVPEELENSILLYMKQTGGDPEDQAGANKTDIALHWLYRGCLQEDKSVIDKAVLHSFMPLAYVASNQEGIQYDLSYFQHGSQLYVGGYAPVMLSGVTRVAEYTADTEYKLSANQLNVLYKFINETYMKSIRGHVQFYNVVGRSVSRPGALNCSGFTGTLDKMKRIDPAHSAEYDKQIAILKGNGYGSITDNFTHYYIGDWSLFQGKNYSVGVRMASNRTRKCENGNKENLKGFFMSDGSMNLALDGEEYFDIFPTWDWNRVPGVTNPQMAEIPLASSWGEAGESEFCGGLSAEANGLSGFRFTANTHGISMSANKAWFFLDGRIVCLGSGITSSMAEPINTTVNQCMFKDNLAYAINGQENTASIGAEVSDQSLDWIWHGNVGYFFPEEQKVSLKAENRNGSWYEINNTRSKDQVEKEVCTIWLNHGTAPSNATYSYIIVPGIDNVGAMKNYNIKDTEIIANSANVQAVQDVANNMIQAMFYQKGSISANGIKVSVDKPCALMLQKSGSNFELYFSDPSHKLSSLTVTVEYNNSQKSYTYDAFGEDSAYKGKTHHTQLAF